MKIISFSLWGQSSKYLLGAIENIKCQKQLLPDWKCRFYCHSNVNLSWINKLYREGGEVILKDEEPVIAHMDAPGMFWRFEVLKDPDVERFIVRDTDGRITQREKNCVLDWIKSKKEFHIIRDHPMHNTKIMGGMWGATREFSQKINYDSLIEQFSKMSYSNVFATDQEFLARMLYPIAKDNMLVHDDLDRFKEGARKIPHFKIDSHYIGEPIEVKL